MLPLCWTQRLLFAGSVTRSSSVQYNKKGHIWVEICARLHYVLIKFNNFSKSMPQTPSIYPYVFSCKKFVKSDFFVYSHLEHSSDEKKGIAFFSNSLNL